MFAIVRTVATSFHERVGSTVALVNTNELDTRKLCAALTETETDRECVTYGYVQLPERANHDNPD